MAEINDVRIIKVMVTQTRIVISSSQSQMKKISTMVEKYGSIITAVVATRMTKIPTGKETVNVIIVIKNLKYSY